MLLVIAGGYTSPLVRCPVRARWLPRWTLASAAIALTAGLFLPFAPVDVSRIDVTWPQRDGTAESTALLLVNQTPHTLDATFDQVTVRAAARSGGIVFATIDPTEPESRALGLVIETQGGQLIVTQRGRSVSLDADVGGSWSLHSSTAGTSVSVDGAIAAEWPDVVPPQVDALLTDAEAPEGMAVALQLVDDSNSQPSAAKVAAMIILWLAAATTLVLLAVDDRRRASGPRHLDSSNRRARWRRRLSAWDPLVVAALVGWAVIGPMTDDDGYYAQMALNADSAGYVGNYFQMFNQSFAPFTWFWQFLSFWQEIGGRSPLWLRLPSVVAAAAAWFFARRFLDTALATQTIWLRRLGRALLAVAFLAWWLAFDIGSRPESLGALAGVIALTATARAIETRRLLPVSLGALVAGLAFAAHPTGAVAFAPLVLGIPAFWSIARDGVSASAAVGRTIAVLSVGSIALFAAFADGSLHDVITGRALFSSVETPLGPADERIRYSLLLSDAPMGSYAKRAVVLLALLLLVWFLLAFLASRLLDRSAMPLRLALVGGTLPVSLLALLITPSKWTHHFGAIAGVGPLFIALVALGLPAVVRALSRGEAHPRWLAPVALVSLVPVIALTFRGRNTWAYAWDQGMINPGAPPEIAGWQLGSVPLWVGTAGVIAMATVFALRRDGRSWRDAAALYAVPALAGVFLLTSTSYLVIGFASTLHPPGGFSVAAATAADPAGRECRVSDAVTIWDGSAGSTLAVSSVPSETVPSDTRPSGDPFALGAWPEDDRLPGGLEGWASHGAGDAAVGVYVSPWYSIGEVADGDRIGVLAGGRISEADDTDGFLEFASEDGRSLSTVAIADTAPRPGWTTLVAEPSQIPDNASLVRVVAVDGSTAPGGWIGVSEPMVIPAQRMTTAFPADAPTAVGWAMSFWFPCQRPMALAQGVIEPPVMATSWGPGAPDNIWLTQRGGSLAGVTRLASVTTAASEMTGAGSWWGRVVLFDYDVALDAYDLAQGRVTTWGFESPFGTLPQLIDVQ